MHIIVFRAAGSLIQCVCQGGKIFEHNGKGVEIGT